MLTPIGLLIAIEIKAPSTSFQFHESRLDVQFSKDYNAIALPALLADVQKATGVNLTSEKALDEDMAIVSITDRTYAEALAKVAEVLHLTWTKNGGGFVLVRPPDRVANETKWGNEERMQIAKIARDEFKSRNCFTSQEIAKLEDRFRDWYKDGRERPGGSGDYDMNSTSWESRLGYDLAPDRLAVAALIADQPLTVWQDIEEHPYRSITFSTDPGPHEVRLGGEWIVKVRNWVDAKNGRTVNPATEADAILDFQGSAELNNSGKTYPFRSWRHTVPIHDISRVVIRFTSEKEARRRPVWITGSSTGGGWSGMIAEMEILDRSGDYLADASYLWNSGVDRWGNARNWLQSSVSGYVPEPAPKDYSHDPVMSKTVIMPEDSWNANPPFDEWLVHSICGRHDEVSLDPLNCGEAQNRIAIAKAAGCSLVSDAFDTWGYGRSLPSKMSLDSMGHPLERSVGRMAEVLAAAAKADVQFAGRWMTVGTNEWARIREMQLPRRLLRELVSIESGGESVSLDSLSRIVGQAKDIAWSAREDGGPFRGRSDDLRTENTRKSLEVWANLSDAQHRRLLEGQGIPWAELTNNDRDGMYLIRSYDPFRWYGGLSSLTIEQEEEARWPDVDPAKLSPGLYLVQRNLLCCVESEYDEDGTLLERNPTRIEDLVSLLKAGKEEERNRLPIFKRERGTAFEYALIVVFPDGKSAQTIVSFINRNPKSEWSIEKVPADLKDLPKQWDALQEKRRHEQE